MRGVPFKPSHEVRVRDAGKGQGGRGSNGGHGGGSGGGSGSGHEEGGGGAGSEDPGGDNTSTAGTSTQQETTTTAIAAATSASAKETSTRANASETTSTTVARSSDSTAVSAVISATATAQTTSTAATSSEVADASSTVLTKESTTVDSALTPSQTTSAVLVSSTATTDSSGTYSSAVSDLSATSSATPSSSSYEGSNSNSLSSSHAGIIAGVIVGLFSCIAIGFIIYRFRKTRPIQRMIAPFQKSTDMQNRPYQDMEKSCAGMAPDMTGETLVGVKTMRKTAPSSSLPTGSVLAGGVSAGSHLIVDTEYLGPAAAGPVSPVSSVSDLGPEVSPVSSASTRSKFFPTQQSLTTSQTLGTHRAVSMAGSEARIVSIPPRSSRALKGGAQSGSSRQAIPRDPSRGPLSGNPPTTARAFKSEAGGGRNWQSPSQATWGPAELRPPPLSINRDKQFPPWPQSTSRQAGTMENAGYRPYRPSMSRQPQRVSQGSMSGASFASSDVFSLTDAISWPKPPRTPTASPDRH